MPRVFAAAIGVSLLMTIAGSILPAWRADPRRSDLAATRADYVTSHKPRKPQKPTEATF